MNYYTLEYHLEKICLENKEFEILDSIWKLNKRTLSAALQSINFNFPHYSLHEGSHSTTIISNIESFLGEDRIKLLEPTDTWLILMSAYSHDLGMIILNKTIEETLPNDTLMTFLSSLSIQNRDLDLKEAANLLLSLKEQPLKIDKSIFDIRKSIVYVIGEFYRNEHANRSRSIINGTDTKMRELLANFYSELIPNRFLNLLSEISFSHGVNFNFLLENLEYQSNGISRDKIHPRFVAALLRLGDLLDVDDKRFNPISELLLDNQLPKTSELHRIKHASVKHLLITSSKIEVTVDCPNPQVFRIARNWFDWLEEEVENQNKNWGLISPEKLSFFPPKINANGVKVLFNSNIADADIMNLRFAISPQKAIEIFEGKGIYEDSSFVFLRELVQNAVDASKLQMWKDISTGNYNELLFTTLHKKYPELNELNKFESHKFIKFPHDIPNEIYSNYQVDLHVKWLDEKKEKLNIKVIDKGTGISKSDLLRMTQKVGESRANDYDFQQLKKTMPYWLKPTGAFGLGLQSVFLVADTFEVQTKADNDISYEIVFNSSKNGEYSYIKNFNSISHRGTTVDVIVSENNFPHAFGQSFSFNLIHKYDYFSADDQIQIDKIEQYLKETMVDVRELNVYITNKGKIKSSVYSSSTICEKNKDLLFISESIDLSLNCETHKGQLLNTIDIIGDLGSELTIHFIDDFDSIYSRNFERSFNYLYLVRDIPIKDNQYGFRSLPFCSLQWNLLNPDSDKILNLSRSKLISDVKNEHNTYLLKNIFPNILNLLWNAYTNHDYCEKLMENKIDVNQMNITLFHLYQTSRIFDIDREIPSSFSNHYFPLTSIIYKDSDEAVSFRSFLECEDFSIIKIGTEYNKKDALDSYINSNLKEIKAKSKSSIIALYQYYFEFNRINYYLIEETTFYSEVDNQPIRILKFSLKGSKERCALISKELTEDYLKLITTKSISDSVINRNIIPSFENYHSSLSVSNSNYPFNNNYLSEFSNYIISPIKSNFEVDYLMEYLEKSHSEEELSNILFLEVIRDLVPASLIEWVKNNPPMPIDRNTEEILMAYSNLLAKSLYINYKIKKIQPS